MPIQAAELNAAPKIDVRERELNLVGASGGDGEMNATHAGANLSAEREAEANGLDRCVGELGMTQADTTQSVDQHVGHAENDMRN